MKRTSRFRPHGILLGLVLVVGAPMMATLGSPVGSSAALGAPVVVTHRPLQSINATYTLNWAGYVAKTAHYTSVSASWVQPAVKCGANNEYVAAFWVGLDGYSSNSVEQLGADSDCSRGTPSYYAWFEMYPAASVNLSSSTYPVKAGDTLTGTVTHSGTSYTLSLTDAEASGGKWTFSQPESASDANASAEWVAEAPQICFFIFCQQASLTNFGTVTFSGAQAAAGAPNAPISSFTASGGPHDITMVSSTGTVKAQPSSLAAGGEGFTDTWHHS